MLLPTELGGRFTRHRGRVRPREAAAEALRDWTGSATRRGHANGRGWPELY